MEVLTFAGRYEDRLGSEALVWRVEGSRRYVLPSPDFFTAIRGVEVWGTDFDSLEPVDTSAVADRLFLTGRAARGAQVRPFGGLSPWPASSSKQM